MGSSHAALLFMAFWLVCRPAADAACMRIAVDPGALGAKATAKFMHALYDEAGLCVTILEIPNKRIVAMLRDHALDGEGGRTAEYIETSPDLIAIPTPLVEVTGMLYWPKGRQRPQSKEQVIGYIRGYIWPPMVAQELGLGTTEVTDQVSLAKMTLSGRIDGFFMTDSEFARILKGSDAEFDASPVRSLTVYHSVTRDHAALVPILDQALRKLKASGAVQQLYRAKP
jgi:hypothetical protein